MLSVNPGNRNRVLASGFFDTDQYIKRITFTWNSGRSKSDHNGWSVIDPSHSAEPAGQGWYHGENIGTGVWEREENQVKYAEEFGAGAPDGETTARALTAMGLHIKKGDTLQLSGIYDCGENFPSIIINASDIEIKGPAAIRYKHTDTKRGNTYGHNRASNIIGINMDGQYRSNYRIRDIIFENYAIPYSQMQGKNGIWFRCGSDLVIQSCTFLNIPQHSIVLRQRGANEVDRVLIKDVIVNTCCGSDVTYAGQTLALGARVDRWNPEPYYLTDLVLDNVIVDSSGDGIPNAQSKTCAKIHNGRNVTVQNSYFKGWDAEEGSSGSFMITHTTELKFFNNHVDGRLMLVGREDDQDMSWNIRDTVVTGRTYLMNQYGICDGITFTNVESDIYISNGGSGLPNEARNIHFRSCNIPVISNIIWKESSFTDCQLPGLVVNNGHRNLSFTRCEVGSLVEFSSSSDVTGQENALKISDCRFTNRVRIRADYTEFTNNYVYRSGDKRLLEHYASNCHISNNTFHAPDVSRGNYLLFLTGSSSDNSVTQNTFTQDPPREHSSRTITDSGTRNRVEGNRFDRG